MQLPGVNESYMSLQACLCVPSNLRGSRQLRTAPNGLNRPSTSRRVPSNATLRTTSFVVDALPGATSAALLSAAAGGAADISLTQLDGQLVAIQHWIPDAKGMPLHD